MDYVDMGYWIKMTAMKSFWFERLTEDDEVAHIVEVDHDHDHDNSHGEEGMTEDASSTENVDVDTMSAVIPPSSKPPASPEGGFT